MYEGMEESLGERERRGRGFGWRRRWGGRFGRRLVRLVYPYSLVTLGHSANGIGARDKNGRTDVRCRKGGEHWIGLERIFGTCSALCRRTVGRCGLCPCGIGVKLVMGT